MFFSNTHDFLQPCLSLLMYTVNGWMPVRPSQKTKVLVQASMLMMIKAGMTTKKIHDQATREFYLTAKKGSNS